MTTTTFVDNSTVVPAAWLNDVDTATYKTLSSVSGTNTITATGPANATLAAGLAFEFIAAGANTGAVTLNVTPSGGAALGAKSITKFGTTALVTGDIVSGGAYRVIYDGTRFVLLNPGIVPAANTSGLAASGAITASGLTQTTARVLGRTTASTGAVEELTSAQVTASFVDAASDTAAGKVELATSAEVQTGTDTARAPSVSSMRTGLTVIGSSASASGTSVAYSSIPSWVTEINCHFSGVSSTSTGHIIIQIGTGGGATTSGYSSASTATAATNTVVGTSATNGFVIYTGVAGDTFTGCMTIRKMTGNQWTSTHAGNKSGYVSAGGGDVTLAGTLDYLRFLNTTGDFDAGTVNITYR